MKDTLTRRHDRNLSTAPALECGQDSVSKAGLSILYIGNADGGTCKARRKALEDLGNGLQVVTLDDHIGFCRSLSYSVYGRLLVGPPVSKFNRTILTTAKNSHFDWVWVDKGILIFPEVIKELRAKGLFLIHHMTDDFMNPKQWLSYRYYKRALLDYHVHLTSNTYNVHELKDRGVEFPIQTYLGFDPELCRSVGSPPLPREEYRADVAFVGFWRKHLDKFILPLIHNGFKVRLWGTRWNLSPNRRAFRGSAMFGGVPDEDYAAVYASAKIALCFLNHENRNTSTGRSFEIPAIGTFMLAERTEEHARFYTEGQEAEFFDSPEELLQKAEYYLSHDDQRERIAKAGQQRAFSAGYSYYDRISQDLKNIMPIYESFRNSSGRRNGDRKTEA